jgi:Domain of unknown function (DUF4190)
MSVMIDSLSSTSSATCEPADNELAALPLWTFTLGVLAVLTFGLTSVPAIICGHRALAETRRLNGESLGRHMALIGLLIGYFALVLFGTWIMLLAEFLSGS